MRRQFPTSLVEVFASLTRNRGLILTMAKRDVVGRYRGSVMGLLWSFFNPLFMLAVYTFVFGVVFKTRWGTGTGSKTEFALILFAGLIVFNLFSECVNRAPGIILANTNYVKKVVFPLEILPWVSLGSVLFHAAVSTLVWVVAYIVFFGIPHLTVLLLPIAIIPLLLFTMGVSWALASLGVYLRDVSQIVGIGTTVLMFLSPIFYPITAVPERVRPILMLNPLSPALDQVRDLLFYGRIPGLRLWAATLLAAIVICWLGFAWFQKTRKGFADVL